MKVNASIRLILLACFCLSTFALFGKSYCNLLDSGGEDGVGGSCHKPTMLRIFAENIFGYSERSFAFISNENKLGINKGFRSKVSKITIIRQASEKQDKGFWLLITLGIMSLLLLILIAKLQLIGYIGFVFYFLATGLGYLLSRKDRKGKRNPLPKILFITAILGNLVGALFASIFKNLD